MIDSVESQKRKPGRKGLPWEQWFLTSGFILVKDVDYKCRTYAMAQTVRNAAIRFGIEVEVKVSSDEQSVTVWVKGPKDEDEDE